jgi:hypothetical protein
VGLGDDKNRAVAQAKRVLILTQQRICKVYSHLTGWCQLSGTALKVRVEVPFPKYMGIENTADTMNT